MKKVLFSLIAVLALTFSASALQIPDYLDKTGMFITNASLTIPAATTVTITNGQFKPMPVQPGVGFAFQPIFSSTNAASIASVIYNIQLSLDGTNYSTSNALSFTNAQNGTNNVIGYFEVPASAINNAKWARLGSVQVATSTNSSVLIGTRWQWRVEPLRP